MVQSKPSSDLGGPPMGTELAVAGDPAFGFSGTSRSGGSQVKLLCDTWAVGLFVLNLLFEDWSSTSIFHIISDFFPPFLKYPKINRCMTVRSFRLLSMGHSHTLIHILIFIYFVLQTDDINWQWVIRFPFFTPLFIVAIRFAISKSIASCGGKQANSCRICLLHLSFLCIHMRNLKLCVAQKPQN